MGTEVIRACIERLIELKKVDIIYQIATFGGVADKQRVEDLLKSCPAPLYWNNFQSKRDFAVRYLYRVCTMGGRSIGASGIKNIPGH